MKQIKSIVNIGWAPELNSREERLLKYGNATYLIVLCFILLNIITFLFFGTLKDWILLVVSCAHFIFISGSLFLNALKKYFLAKVNFALAAIVFVSFYAVAFGQIGYNYLFLPMVAFLLFNLFDFKEKITMWILIAITSVSYLAVLYLNKIGVDSVINIDRAIQEKQGPLSLLGSLVLTIIFGYYNFKLIVNAENRLSAEKKEVKSQKEVIEKVHKEITDSIMYAKRIQQAILPADTFILSYLKESFILYRPKDVVSGDFYWVEQTRKGILFAAADCTGHGVPGAMVSVLCNGALNRSVREFGLFSPGEILDKTREIIIKEFEKSAEDVKDGMDISLCALDTDVKKLQWAGANNPLWIIRDAELIETKPDKQPIGKTEKLSPFTTHFIDLKKGDCVYLFTDGLQDQFGGERGKKFKASKFKQLLLSIYTKPMEEQRQIIITEFENWKGKLEQVDDVCVLCVKI